MSNAFMNAVCDTVDEAIVKSLEDGGTIFDSENLEENIYNAITEKLKYDLVETDDEDELAEITLEAREIANIYLSELREAVNEDDDEDEDGEDDEDEDGEDDEDEDGEDGEDDDIDEDATRHKITRMQAVIDKRKRQTDPKYKKSRERTLRKIQARGGRVLNKKLSKSLKKSYNRGFGKSWFNDSENDIVAPDKKKVSKILAKKTEVCKESIAESMEDAFNAVKSFGTLNEDESIQLKDAVKKIVVEAIDKNAEIVSEALLEEMNTYINHELIPEMNNLMESYINDEVIPAINKDVDQYLNYVADEIVESMDAKNLIVKSKQATKNEEFIENLINLIESELHIYPEQEDALEVMETKLDVLESKLTEERIKKVEYRKQMEEAEKAIYLLKAFKENNVSEAAQEYIMEELEECESFDEFIKNAKRMIDESNENQFVPTLKNNPNNTSTVNEHDYISKTMELLKK